MRCCKRKDRNRVRKKSFLSGREHSLILTQLTWLFIVLRRSKSDSRRRENKQIITKCVTPINTEQAHAVASYCKSVFL
jgi:hypothetical protein